jgi:hypothetical protein
MMPPSLFLREFDQIAEEADGSEVTRFFKPFPLIGRVDVGLDRCAVRCMPGAMSHRLMSVVLPSTSSSEVTIGVGISWVLSNLSAIFH